MGTLFVYGRIEQWPDGQICRDFARPTRLSLVVTLLTARAPTKEILVVVDHRLAAPRAQAAWPTKFCTNMATPSICCAAESPSQAAHSISRQRTSPLSLASEPRVCRLRTLGWHHRRARPQLQQCVVALARVFMLSSGDPFTGPITLCLDPTSHGCDPPQMSHPDFSAMPAAWHLPGSYPG